MVSIRVARLLHHTSRGRGGTFWEWVTACTVYCLHTDVMALCWWCCTWCSFWGAELYGKITFKLYRLLKNQSITACHVWGWSTAGRSLKNWGSPTPIWDLVTLVSIHICFENKYFKPGLHMYQNKVVESRDGRMGYNISGERKSHSCKNFLKTKEHFKEKGCSLAFHILFFFSAYRQGHLPTRCT